MAPGRSDKPSRGEVGTGQHLLLADLRRDNADAAAKTSSEAGFDVTTSTVDVSSRAAVEASVAKAGSLGDVQGVIHAAGVSPSPASPDTILKVDHHGTALVLGEFGKVIADGSARLLRRSAARRRRP